MMKKTDAAASPTAVLGLPVLVGLVIVLLAIALFSALLLSGKVGENMVRPLAAAALALGCVSTSFLAACRAGSNRFLWALAAGGCLFAGLIALGFIWVGRPVAPASIALNVGAALSASCVGALLGTGIRKKKKRRRTR